MSLALVVGTPGAPPHHLSRVLAVAPYMMSKRAARKYADTNAISWRPALEPGESRWLAIATDRNGRIVFVREYARDERIKPREYSRRALAEFRGQR